MSGSYGTVRSSDFIPSEHAEIWLSYREDRSVANSQFVKKDINAYLAQETDGTNPISGLYQLKLPLDVFNKIGVYNIFIRPRQIETTIKDVGVLASYPDIRGIVIDTTSLPTGVNTDNDGLVGYRVEYFDSFGNKKPNLFRIVTSNNKCEPTNQNTNGTISYRFNDNSNLSFLTLTPSSASNARPLSLPFIGSPQDKIVISNTFFNPEMIEIEMTSNDIESLYMSINGDQIRTLDNNLTTTYDKDGNIINQKEIFVIKKTETGEPVYQVLRNKSDIDFTQNYNEIISKA